MASRTQVMTSPAMTARPRSRARRRCRRQARASSASEALAAAQKKAASEGGPGSEIEARVRATLHAILKGAVGVDVSPETAFYELGLSSRQMMELVAKAEDELAVDVPPSLIFACADRRRAQRRARLATLIKQRDGVDGGDGALAAAATRGAGAGGAANAPIAVVGTSCRCPAGATSLEAFWSALAAGVDAAGEILLALGPPRPRHGRV